MEVSKVVRRLFIPHRPNCKLRFNTKTRQLEFVCVDCGAVVE
jgi:hypothetical protein